MGRTNWFHLSNVLPLASGEVPLTLPDRLKLLELGRRIKRNAYNADIISAESAYSLSLIDDAHRGKLVLSSNGSDDELAYLQDRRSQPRENIATVVGTYGYKALEDSYRVFEMLRQANEGLSLVIIGNDEYVPKQLRRRAEIVLKGVLRRRDVLKTLSTSRYYISTTRIENSSNAASEGVVFAQESFVSDIAPHRELLAGTPFRLVKIPGVARPLLHVVGADMSAANLRSWQEVISDMISRVPTPG
ncbi:MAG: hypothetical protein M3Z54_12780 [Gemmatimonadota bacterium]|nr:hypothetical protein [Gemmatimonadota bacterium]